MAMALLKFILIVAITMALSITLMIKGIGQEHEAASSAIPTSPSYNNRDESSININYQNQLGFNRKSRFLAGQEKNPRAADHCHKDHEVCYYDEYVTNSTCCNNKCVDLLTDDKNCGACKNKCKYTETCCRGECVNLSYDKRHCGFCNHRCDKGEFCVYGLCNYP